MKFANRILPNKRQLALCLCLAAILTGCARKIERVTYDLAPNLTPSIAKKLTKPIAIQILIAEPTALRIFDGLDILVKGRLGSLAALPDSQWSDRLPRLIQSRLIQLLENSAAFRGVGRRGEGINAQYILWLDIRSFEVQLMANNFKQAKVELGTRLINIASGNIIASKSFSQQEIFRPSASESYVEALNKAFTKSAQQLTSWLLTILAGNNHLAK